MVYHVRALHNYFIQWHGKYNGQHNECDIRVAPLEELGVIASSIQRLSSIRINSIFYGSGMNICIMQVKAYLVLE